MESWIRLRAAYSTSKVHWPHEPYARYVNLFLTFTSNVDHWSSESHSRRKDRGVTKHCDVK